MVQPIYGRFNAIFYRGSFFIKIFSTFFLHNLQCLQALENGDCFKAAIDLSLGKPLKSPKIKPGTYGLNAYINVFTSGRAGDMVDFSQAQKLKEISLYVTQDQIVKHKGI